MILYDIRVKSPNPLCACTKMGEKLNDPPHIGHEVRNASDIGF